MTTPRIYLASAVILATIAHAQPARAQPDVAEPAHAHAGLYLQFTPGVSVAATGTKLADDTQVSLSGPGSSVGIEVGYAIAENWLLGLDLSGNVVLGPTLKNGGTQVDANKDVKWSTYYAGVAFTHYFMPLNLRVAGGVGVLQMALDLPDMPMETSKTGAAAKLAVAKEWWVSDHWGLGVGLESMLGAVPDDKPADKGWGVFGLSLAMSATYN